MFKKIVPFIMHIVYATSGFAQTAKRQHVMCCAILPCVVGALGAKDKA